MKEMFLLPIDRDQYLIYAPLKAAVIRSNGTIIQLVKDGLKSGYWPDPIKEIGNILSRPDVFETSERFDQSPEFAPTGAMIELTTRCGLRCKYCYADGGSNPIDLPWEAAKAAIDFVYRNAVSLDKENFSLFFHGRGEPTVNWSLLTRCVDYATDLSRSGPKPLFRMATNGMLTSGQLDYIVAHFQTLSLSLDGPADIHDSNRVTEAGSGSFSQVFRTAETLFRKGFPFGVKSVVTSDGVEDLEVRADFFQVHFPGVSVGFEPVNEFGRAKKSGIRTPDDAKFVKTILKLMRKATNMESSAYSGVIAPEEIRLKFCGAMKPSFGLHADGNVMACVGVPMGNDHASVFNYGTFDAHKGSFVFYPDGIQALRALLRKQFAKCDLCFAKWNCGGDCSTYRLFQEGNASALTRCKINRALLRELLLARTRANN